MSEKNKLLSKGKTRIVEPDNTQEQTPDEANSEPKASVEPQTNSTLDETSLTLDNITSNPDMQIHLELKRWAENKED